MARTPGTVHRRSVRLTTFTRFYLPLDQQWPVWAGRQGYDVYTGPLSRLDVFMSVYVGRMIDSPQQAVFIIGEYFQTDSGSPVLHTKSPNC